MPEEELGVEEAEFEGFELDEDTSILSQVLERETAGLLILRDNLPQPAGWCTICRDANTDSNVSYILSEEERKHFDSFKDAGLLPETLANPDDIDNLIWTCTSCASLFKSPTPSLIILPNRLKFFNNWEHRDYERRTEEANSGGKVSSRTVPEHDDYNSGYSFHVVSDEPIPEKLKERIEAGKTDVYTEASPTALILHAGKTIGMPQLYPLKYKLGSRKRREIFELFRLWERPAPVYTETPAEEVETPQIEHPDLIPETPGRTKQKRARKESSEPDSDSNKSDCHTPKSKRQKLKMMTRKDDKVKKENKAKKDVKPKEEEDNTKKDDKTKKYDKTKKDDANDGEWGDFMRF